MKFYLASCISLEIVFWALFQVSEMLQIHKYVGWNESKKCFEKKLKLKTKRGLHFLNALFGRFVQK